MPKVKVFFAEEDYSDYGSLRRIVEGVSGWEEVSLEDVTLLKRYKHLIKTPGSDCVPIVIAEDDVSVISHISSIKTFVQKEKEKREKATAARREMLKKKKLARDLKSVEAVKKKAAELGLTIVVEEHKDGKS